MGVLSYIIQQSYNDDICIHTIFLQKKWYIIFKIILGLVIDNIISLIFCLILLYVPQKYQVGELSLIDDIWINNLVFRNVCFTFNIVSSCMSVALYCYELKREFWLNGLFCIDLTKSACNLRTDLNDHENLLTILKSKNAFYFYFSITNGLIDITNIVLSGIFIFDNHILDYTTYISFLTCCGIIFKKIYNSIVISYTSWYYNQGISAFIVISTYYNRYVIPIEPTSTNV